MNNPIIVFITLFLLSTNTILGQDTLLLIKSNQKVGKTTWKGKNTLGKDKITSSSYHKNEIFNECDFNKLIDELGGNRIILNTKNQPLINYDTIKIIQVLDTILENGLQYWLFASISNPPNFKKIGIRSEKSCGIGGIDDPGCLLAGYQFECSYSPPPSSQTIMSQDGIYDGEIVFVVGVPDSTPIKQNSYLVTKVFRYSPRQNEEKINEYESDALDLSFCLESEKECYSKIQYHNINFKRKELDTYDNVGDWCYLIEVTLFNNNTISGLNENKKKGVYIVNPIYISIGNKELLPRSKRKKLTSILTPANK